MIAINRLYITLIVAFTLFLPSCRGNDVDSKIIAAENALANSDYQMAQRICDEIVSSDSTEPVSAMQLCRLSMIFMELSECINQSTNVGFASTCYNRAVKMEPDSAAVFFESLPIDCERHVHMLRAFAMTYERPDSLYLVDFDSMEMMIDSLDSASQLVNH